MSNEMGDRQFSDWLAARVTEAKLTSEEKKVFSDWLMKETPSADLSPASASHDNAKATAAVSVHDVQQLFSWLKDRIKTTELSHAERSQFNDWIVQLVKEHPTVDHSELEKIKRHLVE